MTLYKYLKKYIYIYNIRSLDSAKNLKNFIERQKSRYIFHQIFPSMFYITSNYIFVKHYILMFFAQTIIVIYDFTLSALQLPKVHRG